MKQMNVKALIEKYNGTDIIEFIKDIVLHIRTLEGGSANICAYAEYTDGTSVLRFGRKPGKGAKQSFQIAITDGGERNPVKAVRFIVETFSQSGEAIGFLEMLRSEASVLSCETGCEPLPEKPQITEILSEKENSAGGNSQIKYGIFAASSASFKLLGDIELFAASRMPVLVTGETGCGKELVANALHTGSRRKGRFLAINCAAIPKELIESELFGHTKGAYTGANQEKEGYFHAADQGTLFLDEIGELSLDLQAKLLRVLQEQKVRRVGSNNEEDVSVRIVAATNRNLKDMVTNGEFRADLYYRLHGLVLTIAPLKDRPEEICPLINFLLSKLSAELGMKISISRQAREKLMNHDFPGNVRELVNLLESGSVIAGSSGLIEPHHLRIGGEIQEPDNKISYAPVGDAADRTERSSIQTERNQGVKLSPEEKLIEMFWGKSFDEMQEILGKVIFTHALNESDGKIKSAARLVGMERSTFSRQVKKMQLLEINENGKKEIVGLRESLEDFDKSFNLSRTRSASVAA